MAVFDPGQRQSDLEQIPVPLIVYDSHGVVVRHNRAAASLFGGESLVGTKAADAGWLITDAAGWPEPQNVHPALAALRHGEQERGVVARATTAAGAEVWLHVDATPVRSADGSVDHVLVSLSDISSILHDVRLPRPAYGAAAIATVTDQLAAAPLDPQTILETVVQTLSKLRPGTWVASLMDKDPRTIKVLAANDDDPLIAEYIEAVPVLPDAPTQTMTNSVIASGEPLLIPSVAIDEYMAQMNAEVRDYIDKHPPPTTAKEMGILIVPMHAHGAVVGTLGLYEHRGSNPLTPRDIRWVQEIADRTGMAAENAQLYVDAISRLDRLTALRSVQLAIATGPDLRLTFKVILDQAVQSLAVDAADLLLVDETDGQMRLVASAGFRSTAIPDFRLPVNEGITGQAAIGRRIETVSALGAFSQFRRRSLFAREGFKAYGAEPLINRGKLIGVLEVFHRSALQPDSEWLEFFDSLATEAAIAIEHASLRASGSGTPQPARPAPADLSRLDRDILVYVADGLSNKAIAEKVHLSTHAIKFHIGQLLDRLGAANRTELAQKATREGWI